MFKNNSELVPGNLENAVELPANFSPAATVRPNEKRVVFIPNANNGGGTLWSQEQDSHWREYHPVRETAPIMKQINKYR